MWSTAGQTHHQRLFVDSTEPSQRLLRGTCDDLGAQVQEHQQVAHVAGKKRHLVSARDQHFLGFDDRVHGALDRVARKLARGLLDVDVIGRERRLEFGVV